MKMIECEKGHLYDEEKFYSCPHCANEMAIETPKNILAEGRMK